MTQHTDEPSDAEWDELRDIIAITYDKGVDPRDFVNTLFAAGYRKVSRLSHPTLSADRNAVIEEASQCVPTNWLDTLLTGPDGLSKGDRNDRDIEKLLRGIQTRIRALKQ